MTSDQSHTSLSRGLLLVMAIATGTIVANLYYLQPLLHQVRGELHVSTRSASLLLTLTQVGYAAGLAFLVPLGDLIERRRLVVAVFLGAAVMMAAGGAVTTFMPFAAVTLVIGLTSVGGQMIIPYAADLAAPAQRGRVVARVMTGLLLGILLSRTFSGLVAQAAGWRTVYWAAAAVLAVVALVLRRVLPREAPRTNVSYSSLVASTFSLLATSSVLRRRAWLGAMAFAAFSTLWTVLSFHLAASPFHYSTAVIGLFGLFGVAGVLAANAAGHFADNQRGPFAAVTAGVLITTSFAVMSLGRNSLWLLALGLVILDAGMQGTHITNQSIIYAIAPDARSRINSAYMVCCFAGASFGSFAAGQVYAVDGWSGECWLGGGLGLALVVPITVWSLRGRARVVNLAS